MKKLPKLIKPGTVWKLGDHYLLYGDCLDAELVERFLKSVKIDAVISDVPYGVKYIESKENFTSLKLNKKIVNDDITSEDAYHEFTRRWLASVLPKLSKKNSIYIFAEKMIFAIKGAFDELGINLSQLLIWAKSQAVMGRKDYMLQHEFIVFGWCGTHAFRKSKDKSLLFYPRPKANPLQPTQKPIELIRHLVLNSTEIGGVVYDPFLGSGTTLIACEQTKRKCFGIEIDLEYCLTTIRRWEHVSGCKAKQI